MRSWFNRLFAVLALFLASGVLAGELSYDRSVFKKALTEGTPVIVDLHADWCTTCKTQKPILRELLNNPAWS